MTSQRFEDFGDDGDLAVRAVQAGLAVARAARSREVIATKAHPADLLTATDLAAEAAIRAVLAAGSALPVQGEEGSPDLAEPDRWVVDPVDGTANFVAELPLVACTVARLADHRPVAAATGDLISGEVVRAVLGGGTWVLTETGSTRARTAAGELSAATVTVGDLSWTSRGAWPLPARAEVLRAVAEVVGRLRVVGTSATELVWVATGRTAAAVLFGNLPWDVAAGVLAVREAGGVVLDAAGQPWSLDSDSVLAAASDQVAEQLVAAVGHIRA
jgi:myo-inositol-1(or 4)-monophosphatase